MTNLLKFTFVFLTWTFFFKFEFAHASETIDELEQTKYQAGHDFRSLDYGLSNFNLNVGQLGQLSLEERRYYSQQAISNSAWSAFHLKTIENGAALIAQWSSQTGLSEQEVKSLVYTSLANRRLASFIFRSNYKDPEVQQAIKSDFEAQDKILKSFGIDDSTTLKQYEKFKERFDKGVTLRDQLKFLEGTSKYFREAALDSNLNFKAAEASELANWLKTNASLEIQFKWGLKCLTKKECGSIATSLLNAGTLSELKKCAILSEVKSASRYEDEYEEIKKNLNGFLAKMPTTVTCRNNRNPSEPLTYYPQTMLPELEAQLSKNRVSKIVNDTSIPNCEIFREKTRQNLANALEDFFFVNNKGTRKTSAGINSDSERCVLMVTTQYTKKPKISVTIESNNFYSTKLEKTFNFESEKELRDYIQSLRTKGSGKVISSTSAKPTQVPTSTGQQ